MTQPIVHSPESPQMQSLCGELQSMACETDLSGQWPAKQLKLCAQAGVFRWFASEDQGGLGWTAQDQLRGYLKLASADLTTTFILTQRLGAQRRIASSDNQGLAQALLPDLLSGHTFATVGISHLTTSRRHLAAPALAAEAVDGGYSLRGYSPWVTGAAHAQTIVLGATLADGRQLLAAVPTGRKGIQAASGVQLMALTASETARVDCDAVWIAQDELIAGPTDNVMNSGVGASSGGLQTSTLALGLAQAAIEFLAQQALNRPELSAAADQLRATACEMESDLLDAAIGAEVCSAADLRGRANRLVLQATQAAMTAAKGAGYVHGHQANRWCREALFFLVWSCPQQIANAHLCELAGIT